MRVGEVCKVDLKKLHDFGFNHEKVKEVQAIVNHGMGRVVVKKTFPPPYNWKNGASEIVPYGFDENFGVVKVPNDALVSTGIVASVNIQKELVKIASMVLAEREYSYDPKHENKPEGSGWEQTPAGWSRESTETPPRPVGKYIDERGRLVDEWGMPYYDIDDRGR